jgi:hypothetical protein
MMTAYAIDVVSDFCGALCRLFLIQGKYLSGSLTPLLRSR